MKKGENTKFGERNPLTIGSKFNKLTIIKEAVSIEKKWGYHKITKEPIYTPIYHYKCKCDCGEVKLIQKQHLIKNIATSCGCNILGKKEYKNVPRWLVRMFKTQAECEQARAQKREEFKSQNKQIVASCHQSTKG